MTQPKIPFLSLLSLPYLRSQGAEQTHTYQVMANRFDLDAFTLEQAVVVMLDNFHMVEHQYALTLKTSTQLSYICRLCGLSTTREHDTCQSMLVVASESAELRIIQNKSLAAFDCMRVKDLERVDFFEAIRDELALSRPQQQPCQSCLTLMQAARETEISEQET